MKIMTNRAFDEALRKNREEYEFRRHFDNEMTHLREKIYSLESRIYQIEGKEESCNKVVEK